MKAKELAIELLKNPDMDVIFSYRILDWWGNSDMWYEINRIDIKKNRPKELILLRGDRYDLQKTRTQLSR